MAEHLFPTPRGTPPSPDNNHPNNPLPNPEETMAPLLHHARQEALSYLFFAALIAATFFV